MALMNFGNSIKRCVFMESVYQMSWRCEWVEILRFSALSFTMLHHHSKRVENKCKPFIVTMVLTKNATLIMYVCMLIKNAFKEPSRDLKAHTPRTRIYQKLIMRMGQKWAASASSSSRSSSSSGNPLILGPHKKCAQIWHNINETSDKHKKQNGPGKAAGKKA